MHANCTAAAVPDGPLRTPQPPSAQRTLASSSQLPTFPADTTAEGAGAIDPADKKTWVGRSVLVYDAAAGAVIRHSVIEHYDRPKYKRSYKNFDLFKLAPSPLQSPPPPAAPPTSQPPQLKKRRKDAIVGLATAHAKKCRFDLNTALTASAQTQAAARHSKGYGRVWIFEGDLMAASWCSAWASILGISVV